MVPFDLFSAEVKEFDLNGDGYLDPSEFRTRDFSTQEVVDISQCEFQDPEKWRYVSTICLAISCGDIPFQRPLKKALYMVGTSNWGSWNGHWTSKCEKLWFWWGCIKIYATYFWRMITRELTHTHIVADVLSFMLWFKLFILLLRGFMKLPLICLGHIPYIPLHFFFNPDSTLLGIPRCAFLKIWVKVPVSGHGHQSMFNQLPSGNLT